MKTNQTIIPVEIHTDYTHERGNGTEPARQQIELASFYLQSLFNSIKHLASSLESRIDEKEQEFCYDLRNLADIGYAFCGSIFRNASEFEQGEQPPTDEPENHGFGTLDEADTLALALSEILNNENLPVPLFNAINHGLDGIYNESNTDVLTKFEKTPEYLKAVFTAYNKSRGKSDE